MKSKKKKYCLILGNCPESIINFKGDFIKEIIKKNYIPILASSKPDFNIETSLGNSYKIEYKTIFLKRNGLNIFDDIRTFYEITSILKKYKPKFIFASGIKLVIWGGISSRICKTPFFSLITGLGYAFYGGSFYRKCIKKIAITLYKFALKNSKAVIFQNVENKKVFLKNNLVLNSNSFKVNGSGVNLKKYNFTLLPKTNIRFLCIARLLGEKGLREYAAAAKIIKKKFNDVEFELLGPEDPSPDGISKNEVAEWSSYLSYKGKTNDVRPYIKNCHIFVLPSYHEGLPRSTLEAMALGRPIITTDAVGCRDTVEDGKNGFLVSVGSVNELVDRMVWFINNKNKIEIMGKVSRSIVSKKFNAEIVNKKMMKIIGI
jgi:glycosyltransferase involved in cell wall biosynthesis